MTPLVRFRHVSKKYRLGLTRASVSRLIVDRLRSLRRPPESRSQVLWALKDVSFDLLPGESMALIGPNGAGKSTLLKLVSRITMPTDGTIDVRGRLAALLELGAGFHPDLTGRENIYLNGTILGLSRQFISRRFDEIVAFAELGDFINTPIKRYSSGMEVRLGFAVAAALEPEILLVDEVLAVGDASFREKCLQRIRSLIAGGTSVIFVSHNLYMVQAVCNKALYIQKGHVLAAGETTKVVEAYERDLHAERARKLEAALVDGRHDVPDVANSLDITEVIVQGRRGDDGSELAGHEPAQICIHYEAYSDVDAVNMAVFIVRSDGVICCMMRTKLDGYELRLKRGRGMVVVNLAPLQLLTGMYFAEVELTNASDSMVLKMAPARSAWFSVKGRTRSYDAHSGVFEPAVSWCRFETEAGERSGLRTLGPGRVPFPDDGARHARHI